ncbi:MAG TPA: DUF2062 domain-containing protein [Pseudomonadales bacterium]
MPRRLLKKYLPTPEKIRQHESLNRVLGKVLHEPNLWHINRYSTAVGMGIGLFCAFLPIPMQMLLAAVLAIGLRANLPISVSLVWITNPLTMAPIFYFCYRLGAWMLNIQARAPQHEHIHWNFQWVMERMTEIGGPLLLGSITCAVILGLAGYGLVILGWRANILWKLRLRRIRRQRQQ